MPFRKVFFWLHLVAGLIAGVSIAVMCFTGVTLAFEKQLVAWSERDARVVTPPAADAQRLSLDELPRRFREAQPEVRPGGIEVSSDPRVAVVFSVGRNEAYYVNPYTGEVRRPASTQVHDFLHTMEEWHRWLALGGDSRPIGKLINGACNLAFCFLAVSGLYLWWPRSWSWRSVRAITLFNWKLTGKGRDFNWHNVIGLWCTPVLIVLTLTAVPMSFRWGNTLLYRLAGEEAPAQQGPPNSAAAAIELPRPPEGTRRLGNDALFAIVQTAHPAWRTIALRSAGGPGQRGPGGAPGLGRPEGAAQGRGNSEAPRREGSARPEGASATRGEGPRSAGHNDTPARTGPQPVSLTVTEPGLWPRTASITVTLNPFTGDILRTERFSDQSAGRQLRGWTRFLHTGEALGVLGQLVAGFACLGGCFLVYTGVALSYRRFFGRKAPAAGAVAS